jgi:hypothetical protein
MIAGRECDDLGYDLGYLRHGSFGRASADGPADRGAGLPDALARLPRWRRAVAPSNGLDANAYPRRGDGGAF